MFWQSLQFSLTLTIILEVAMGENCVVSCIFGRDYLYVYPAPKGIECHFFTNSKAIRNEVIKKDWKYHFINFPLSDDFAVSSLQSKYIKFLQFIKHKRFQKFELFEYIIYVDHKVKLEEHHVSDLLMRTKQPVLIRKTLRLKDKIWDEVIDAMGQERYRRFMPPTIEYINRKLKNGYSENARVCNTGLIVYKAREGVVKKLVDEVYRDLISIGTSECQIIWALVTQKYAEVIQTIEWDDLPILRGVPRS